MDKNKYRALISSDWNECLSPSRPFDPITFRYPELSEKVQDIFIKYTSNQISYKDALGKIKSFLPGAITQTDMDYYLKEKFSVYPGIFEFINWCRDNHILFMINTTGFIGYFERAISLGLLSNIRIISGSPFIRFNMSSKGHSFLELNEIDDKPKNTFFVATKYKIKRIFLIGDSGGDGPHFVWGRQNGCVLIGCMAKPSLKSFCNKHGVEIDHFVGDYRSSSNKINLIEVIKKYMDEE